MKAIFIQQRCSKYFGIGIIKNGKTKVKVFNTAIKGAKIKNVPLIREEKFAELIARKMNNYLEEEG